MTRLEVEIFRPGTFGGKTYTPADLLAMVRKSDPYKTKPVVIGHGGIVAGRIFMIRTQVPTPATLTAVIDISDEWVPRIASDELHSCSVELTDAGEITALALLSANEALVPGLQPLKRALQDARDHDAGDDARHYEKLFELKGVEVFRVGEWNGDVYSNEDLTAMVDAFGKAGYTPPVKLGHSDDTGGRAWGWVSALRKIGDKLVADFKDLPKSVFDLIVDHAYDAVSAEVFWDLQRGGKTFRRALKAVALLGAEVPAVSGLAPLRTALNELADATFARVATCVMADDDEYEFVDADDDVGGGIFPANVDADAEIHHREFHEGDEHMTTTTITPREARDIAEQEIHRLALDRLAELGLDGTSGKAATAQQYSAAVHTILRTRQDLAKAYIMQADGQQMKVGA